MNSIPAGIWPLSTNWLTTRWWSHRSGPTPPQWYLLALRCDSQSKFQRVRKKLRRKNRETNWVDDWAEDPWILPPVDVAAWVIHQDHPRPYRPTSRYEFPTQCARPQHRRGHYCSWPWPHPSLVKDQQTSTNPLQIHIQIPRTNYWSEPHFS